MKAIVLAAVLCISGNVFAYSGGDGSAGNPYKIANSTDWQELMNPANSGDWDKHFVLTAHLDLAGITLAPVGNSSTKFTGVFDGAGHTLYNAVVDLPGGDNIGLFGYTWPSAAIQNLRLENADITGKFWVGGLVGRTEGTTIENVAFNGTVTGVAYVGAAAGSMSGGANTATRCYSTGVITGTRYVGGLVGHTEGATFENCYSQAATVGVEDAVFDHEDIGGLVGWASNTTVNACYTAGLITTPTGTPNVGGLVGNREGGAVTASFWDTQISGQHTSPVGLGKTTAQMKRRETFTSAGWDFVGVWGDGQSQTYPYLRLRPASDIDGDSRVRLEDVAILAAQWLTETPFITDYDGIEWVIISDPGFVGQISKHETTNAQFAHYLNAAKASNDIRVEGSLVKGNSGPYSGQNYYDLAGLGWTVDGATNAGAARINWTGTTFTVDTGFENHPVTYVSWYGSMAFASYYGWRLPTEWEWQAVADFNGSYTHGCGTTINNSIANYFNSVHPHGTTAVGAFGTYGYGMADMAGNVWEWTSTVSDIGRVLRGGGWGSLDSGCTVSYRNLYYPYNMYRYFGFRVCR